MNSNEGGYTAMWQQQRRDTMAKSFCPMKTDYKLLSCIEYLRTKETLDVGFQVFRRRSSRLLLPPFPLKIFSLVSGKKDRQTTIQWHVLKKTHNGKILLPYDDNLETSLLYRMLEDIRNTRGRFPKSSKAGAPDCCCCCCFLANAFSCQWQRGQTNSNVVAACSEEASFCPMTTD
jgi:hypothetical protein